MMRLKFFARTFTTATKKVISSGRQLPESLVCSLSTCTIQEGWHIGPYDYSCGYAFDPNGFFLQEIDGQFISHTCAIKYLIYHSYLSTMQPIACSVWLLECYRVNCYLNFVLAFVNSMHFPGYTFSIKAEHSIVINSRSSSPII